MKTISVRLPEELIECLNTCSFRSGRNRSDVIRDALKTYLTNTPGKLKSGETRIRRVLVY